MEMIHFTDGKKPLLCGFDLVMLDRTHEKIIPVEQFLANPTMTGNFCGYCVDYVSGLQTPEVNAKLLRLIAKTQPEHIAKITVYAAAIIERFVEGVCPKCPGGTCMHPQQCVHPRREGMSCGPEMADHMWMETTTGDHECHRCHAVMPNPFGPIPASMRGKV